MSAQLIAKTISTVSHHGCGRSWGFCRASGRFDTGGAGTATILARIRDAGRHVVTE